MPRQVLHQFQAVTVGRVAGHIEISDDQVHLPGFEQIDQLVGANGFAHHAKAFIPLNQLTYPQQYNGMVIGNDNIEGFHG
ncbi:hypothetical protein D3C78_1723590 [compost metagenome]